MNVIGCSIVGPYPRITDPLDPKISISKPLDQKIDFFES